MFLLSIHGWSVTQNKKVNLKFCQNLSSDSCYQVANYQESMGNVQQAIRIYMEACLLKHGYSCHRMGWHRESQRMISSSIIYYREACEMGQNRSCNNLGVLYDNLQDRKSANIYFTKACKLGKKSSCEKLENKKSMVAAEKENQTPNWLLKNHLCFNHDAQACHDLGRNFESEDNFLYAKNYYDLGCQMQLKKSCNNLAIIYEKENQLEIASQYFQSACLLGHGQACTKAGSKRDLNFSMLACRYGDYQACINGKNHQEEKRNIQLKESLQAIVKEEAKPIDPAIALEKKCLKNEMEACLEFASYLKGKNQPERVMKIYRDGCEKRNKLSCFELGNLLSLQNKSDEAIASWEKSCQEKMPAACLLIGNEWLKKNDKEKSKVYLTQACELKLDSACILIQKMTAQSEDAVLAMREKSCRGGNSSDCLLLAQTWMKKDEKEKALIVYKLACDQKEEIGCVAYQEWLEKLHPEEYAKEKEKLDPCNRSEKKDLDQCYSQTQKLFSQGDENNALQKFASLCNKMHGKSCERLSEHYLIQKDLTSLEKYLDKSCQLKIGWACRELGFLSLKNNKTKEGKNVSYLIMWEKGCALKDGKSCYQLAVQLQATGEAAKARTLFTQACHLGYGWDCEKNLAH